MVPRHQNIFKILNKKIMFKYKLKKGVSIDVGTAFKYKSIEDLKSLLYAIGESYVLARQAEMSGTSLKETGYLILSFDRPSFSNSKNTWDCPPLKP